MRGQELRPDEQYDGERFGDAGFDQAVSFGGCTPTAASRLAPAVR